MRCLLAFAALCATACAAGTSVARPGSVAKPVALCPRSVTTTPRDARPHGVASVPADPIGGELCVYSEAKSPPAMLEASMALPASRARTVALLIDGRAPGSSCDAGSPVLLRLSYAGGRMLSALASGCSPEVVSIAGRISALSAQGSLALGGLLTLPLNGGPTIRTPDYIGQPVRSVVAAARHWLRGSIPPAVGLGELDDPGVTFGQVVWESPLPGSLQSAQAPQLSIVVGVHRAPRCTADQLLGRYANGGNGTGNHFGNVILLDASPRACTLSGRVRLHGVDRRGAADTGILSVRFSPALVLSPGATARDVLRGPTGALIATFWFGGNARDDVSGTTTCYSHETVPYAWTLDLGSGGTVRFANGAPGEGGPYDSCHGAISFATPAGLLGS
jgi:hypothetical protein